MGISLQGQAIAAASAVLLLGSFLFADSAFLAVGAALLVFLLARRVFFSFRSAAVLRSIAITRSVTPAITRFGRTVRVTTAITAAPSPLSLTAADLLPRGTTLTAGTSAGPLSPDTAIAYTLQVLACGRLPFGGITLSLADPFFSRTVTLATDPFLAPAIACAPQDRPLPGGAAGTGDREGAGILSLPSQTVNGFRAYTEGDDLRRIDWKLTAKRGTPWIREYAGLTGGSVLVVVDCAGTPEDAPALAHLTAAAGGAIDAAIRGGRSCTLLVIAGAAILSVTPVARSADYLPAITALAPLSPPDPLYRALPPAPAPLASPFGTRLARVASAFHAAAHDPPFATQLVRMFLDHDYPAVHACSLCSGDLSHLQILADAAARFRASFTLVVPPARAAPELLQRIRGVEVVRA